MGEMDSSISFTARGVAHAAMVGPAWAGAGEQTPWREGTDLGLT